MYGLKPFMSIFEPITPDSDGPAVTGSRRQLLLAATGVLTIASFVVISANLGSSGRHAAVSATAPFSPPPAPAAPLIDIGTVLATSGLPSLSTETVSTRLLAGQSVVTRGYRNAQGKHEFALVTPEVVAADSGTTVRMNLRVFSLDDAQLVLAGLECTDAGSAIRPGGSRIWTSEDIHQKLSTLPADIHREIPAVTVEAGSAFSANLGESADALFFLEGKAVPTADGNLDLETDLKCVVKNS